MCHQSFNLQQHYSTDLQILPIPKVAEHLRKLLLKSLQMLQQFCCTFKFQTNNCPAVAIAHPSNAPATTWEQSNTQEVSNIYIKKG